MSTILKALKQLEQETAAADGLPLPGDITRRIRWRTAWLIGITLFGMVLCALAGIGFYTLMHQPGAASPPPAAVTPAGLVSGKTPEPKSDVSPVSVAPQPSAAAPPPSSTTKKPTSPVIIARPLPPMASPGPGLTALEEPLPEEAVVDEEISIPSPSSGDDWADLEMDAEPPEDMPPGIGGASRETDLLQDNNLSLQAISWSSDPARRMAVINGSIYKEADRVGDYVLRRINPEDVVLVKGGREGRLVFKMR